MKIMYKRIPKKFDEKFHINKNDLENSMEKQKSCTRRSHFRAH